MPNTAFVSLVGVIHTPAEVRQLATWVQGLYNIAQTEFTDYEFVLVNNGVELGLVEQPLRTLPDEVRPHLFLLNLSMAVDRNNALLAGLDRANGDYTVIFEFDFAEQPQLITQMWEKNRTPLDVVYLRARERRISWAQHVLYRAFYAILKRYSGLHLDPWAHHTRIISRRALNSLLRLREQSHYLKANYALIGYNTGYLEVDTPLRGPTDQTFGAQFRNALLAITSYTDFLRTVMLWMFLWSCLGAVVASANAIKVKLTNVDIFGAHHETLSGWAFLVVLISVFFAVLCFNLYLISIYLSNIYAEIKNRPLYIVESVRRY